MEGISSTVVIVASTCFGACLIVLIGVVIHLRRTLRSFMTGKDGASLEATLAWLTQKIAEIDDTLDSHKQGLEYIDRRVKRSIRGYSLVRYDAYIGAGGTQSFSAGFLDEHADGFILSVVANRNHTGVYAKRINRGTPEASLTEEEAQALQEAKNAIK